MTQFKKITSKSVLLLMIFLTRTTYGFIQTDHRDTSRRTDVHVNRNFPERRQHFGPSLNVRNPTHKIDEKDRVYEILYDRRSFRTGTTETRDSNERYSSSNRREIRQALLERSDNRVGVDNRQRFSVFRNRNAENLRNVNDNRRIVTRNDFTRDSRREISMDRRMDSRFTPSTRNAENLRNINDNRRIVIRNDFTRDSRREISMDRRTDSRFTPSTRNLENRQMVLDRRTSIQNDNQRRPETNTRRTVISSMARQSRASSSRIDSTRQIRDAPINYERDFRRYDRITHESQVTSRSSHFTNDISRTDSTRYLNDNVRNPGRRENLNSRRVIGKERQNVQVRNELSRLDSSERMPDIDRRRNTFERQSQDYRRDLTRNRFARGSIRNNFIRNLPSVTYTRREFRLNSGNGGLYSEGTRKQIQTRRIVPVDHNSPIIYDKPTNDQPQPKDPNTFAVRNLPEKDTPLKSTERRKNSFILGDSQENDDFFKQNLSMNSWATAAQIIISMYFMGQIFWNSSMKNKGRFNMFSALNSAKDKMH